MTFVARDDSIHKKVITLSLRNKGNGFNFYNFSKFFKFLDRIL